MQLPSVGRIVHYHDGTAADPQPAIISAVLQGKAIEDHAVALTVMPTDRDPYRVGPIPYSAEPRVAHWNYPARV